MTFNRGGPKVPLPKEKKKAPDPAKSFASVAADRRAADIEAQRLALEAKRKAQDDEQADAIDRLIHGPKSEPRSP